MYTIVLKSKAIVHYKFFEHSIRNVSGYYKISKSTLSRWIRDENNDKPVIPRTRRSKHPILVATVKSIIDKSAFKTCDELHHDIVTRYQMNASRSTVYRALKTGKYSFKLAMRSYKHQARNMSHPFYSLPDPYGTDV